MYLILPWPKGIHEYPFTYPLPVDLPMSLDDSRYATISYTVKSTVFMTLGRTSSSMEETFSLQALPDPSVPLPLDEDLPKVITLPRKNINLPYSIRMY